MLNEKRLLIISLLVIAMFVVGCSSNNIGEDLDNALLDGEGLKVILEYTDQDLDSASADLIRAIEVEAVNVNEPQDQKVFTFGGQESFEIKDLIINESYSLRVTVKDEHNNTLYIGEKDSVLFQEDSRVDIELEASDNSSDVLVNSLATSSSEVATIYYSTDWVDANIHYRIEGGEWTEVPGLAMEDSNYDGYKVVTIDTSGANHVEAVFNDGAGNWDNNNSNNYIFTDEISTLEDGEIRSGVPYTGGGGEYQATIYYETNWVDANIHYRVNGGTWTEGSGLAMEDSNYEGYKVATINFNEPIDNVEAVFNDGAGNWDNNNSNNYIFTDEISTLEGGEIRSGVPYTGGGGEYQATIYYETNWVDANIHYRVNGGTWTDVPGLAMEDSNYKGYKVATINFNEPIDNVEAVFNDGAGNWDNNNSNNYLFIYEVSTLEKGIITEGDPDSDPNLGLLPNIPENLVNDTIYQAFYWESYEGLWSDIANNEDQYIDVDNLADVGITSMWLPPAAKAANGTDDVGYAVYDFWDLGEFDQHGAVETRYGTRQQLEDALERLNDLGVDSYFDVVFNHRMGGAPETAPVGWGQTIESYTDMTLLGRSAHYSNADQWSWNWEEFNGVDWCANDGNIGETSFEGKYWGRTFGHPYLMGNDVDYNQRRVIDEMKEWGEWIINDVGFSGFRMDAIMHVDSDFVNEWLWHVQNNTEEDIFFVGEAWTNDTWGYLDHVDNPFMTVFDFALRDDFVALSEGRHDMSSWGGLANSPRADRAVTFVDNHDTSRENNDYPVDPVINFKNQAYAYILMREHSIPTVYARDYDEFGMNDTLDKMIEARRYFAYGPGHEVNNNDYHVYSYVREGLEDIPGTGLVMMISDGTSGDQSVKNINSRQPNTTFYDYTGNVSGTVTTDSFGYGDFRVNMSEANGWSIWVPVID